MVYMGMVDMARQAPNVQRMRLLGAEVRAVELAQDRIAVIRAEYRQQLAAGREPTAAFDAAMAALLTLNVTYPEAASFPSVAPTLVYDALSGYP